MDKIAISRPRLVLHALPMRVAVSLGVGMSLITLSGCHSNQSAAVSDTPKTALAPPVQSPDALAREAAGEAQQRELQKEFFEANSPAANGAPIKKSAPSTNPSQ